MYSTAVQLSCTIICTSYSSLCYHYNYYCACVELLPIIATTRHLFQRFALALWRGNACLWLHRHPTLPPSWTGLPNTQPQLHPPPPGPPIIIINYLITSPIIIHSNYIPSRKIKKKKNYLLTLHANHYVCILYCRAMPCQHTAIRLHLCNLYNLPIENQLSYLPVLHWIHGLGELVAN